MGLSIPAIIALGATAAVTVATSRAQVKAANAEAAAIAKQSKIDSKNKRKEIQLKAARAKVSFLNSGLTLEGTPTFSLESIFDTGIEDVNLIGENARTNVNNVISNARSQRLKTIGSGIASGATIVAAGSSKSPKSPGSAGSTGASPSFVGGTTNTSSISTIG